MSSFAKVRDENGHGESWKVIGAGDEAALEAVEAEPMFEHSDADIDESKGSHALYERQGAGKKQISLGIVEDLQDEIIWFRRN